MSSKLYHNYTHALLWYHTQPSHTGTVMSDTFGIAKSATAIAVRVLDANGGGTYAYAPSYKNIIALQHYTTNIIIVLGYAIKSMILYVIITMITLSNL